MESLEVLYPLLRFALGAAKRQKRGGGNAGNDVSSVLAVHVRLDYALLYS
jgi:hypothetical protein